MTERKRLRTIKSKKSPPPQAPESSSDIPPPTPPKKDKLQSKSIEINSEAIHESRSQILHAVKDINARKSENFSILNQKRVSFKLDYSIADRIQEPLYKMAHEPEGKYQTRRKAAVLTPNFTIKDPDDEEPLIRAIMSTITKIKAGFTSQPGSLETYGLLKEFLIHFDKHAGVSSYCKIFRKGLCEILSTEYLN